MAVSTVVFDWDNTIASSSRRVFRNYQRAAEHLRGKYPSIPIPTDAQMREYDRRGDLVFERFVPAFFGTDTEEFMEVYRALGERGDELIPGVKHALYDLVKRYRLGVLTYKARERVEETASNNSLDLCVFTYMYFEPEIGCGKPDGNVFRPLAEDIKPQTLSDALYVGDTTGDLEAVRNANQIFNADMQFIAVLTGSARAENFIAAGLLGNRIVSSAASLRSLLP